MNIVQQLAAEEKARLLEGKTIPDFQPGDTLRVNVRIKEGERERIQAYEGVCIARDGGGINETFTVRKISFGEGVERRFPILSPNVESIEVKRRGVVRRGRCPRLGNAHAARSGGCLLRRRLRVRRRSLRGRQRYAVG